MADNRLAGTLYITIDGRSYAVAGAGTYLVSSTTRETLAGQDGIHGYSEKPAAGHISWNGRDSSALSMSDLNAASDVTVVAQAANGKTIVGRNMWRVGEPSEVNTEDGTYSIRFESADVTEN